jgi:medium-chain acyl-[acyl-carrier-protein] hydrolase
MSMEDSVLGRVSPVPRASSGALIRPRRPTARPAVRLLCLPFAGGSATNYIAWRRKLPETIEVIPVELPGRWSRSQESPATDLRSLAVDIAAEAREEADVPIALFGYSMGAVLAFEIARASAARGWFEPAHLLVAARPAPHVAGPSRPLAHLPDDELLLAMSRDHGALPPELLDDQELRELALAVLRVDLPMLERHRHVTGPPLACPITAFAGAHDELVPVANVERWQELTRGEFTMTTLDAAHFFLRSHGTDLLRVVCERLVPARRPP